MKAPQPEKVLVALGSGVGSLVVAWLLKKQGRQIKGVYFDFIQDPARLEWIHLIEKKVGISVQVIDVMPDLEEKVIQPWLKSRRLGIDISMRKLFQQAILFPKLFELKAAYHFDKVATGHFAITQYDDLAKCTRIMKSVEAERDEAMFLLGLTQEEIQGIELPLGSITSKMSDRLAIELGLDTVEPIRSHPIWKKLQEFAINSLGSEANRSFDVFNSAGERIGNIAGGLKYSMGDLWKGIEGQPPAKETEEPLYVFGVDEKNARIQLGKLSERSIHKINLKKLFWYVQGDLKLKGMSAELSWNPTASVPVKLLEFEGNTAKVFLDSPLANKNATLFSGQTVMLMSGSDVLGGGEVSSCE